MPNMPSTSSQLSLQLGFLFGGLVGGICLGWLCRGMRIRMKNLPEITATNCNVVLNSRTKTSRSLTRSSIPQQRRRSPEDQTDWSDTSDEDADRSIGTKNSQKNRIQATRDCKMVLLVRMDLEMGKGKIAAQCAHAAVGAYQEAVRRKDGYLKFWQKTGQAKIALKVSDESTIQSLAKAAQEAGLNTYIVHDAGRTQIAAGSLTVAAIGPGEISVIDKITGHLKLL